MIKLYLDFDGVILDTINVTYSRLEKLNITQKEEIDKYYGELDWKKLIKECPQINNSIENIKRLTNSNLYDVTILTHVITNHEKEAKIKYINKELGNVNIITVNIKKDKCDAVDCKNAILVDDYINNLESWYKKGGISIKFSDKGKKCKYMTISSLDMLLDKYNEIEKLVEKNKCKKLLINK